MTKTSITLVAEYHYFMKSGNPGRLRFHPRFKFTGPLGTITGRVSFIKFITELSLLVKDIIIRKQFFENDEVGSIYHLISKHQEGFIVCIEWIVINKGSISEIRMTCLSNKVHYKAKLNNDR